MVIKDLGLSILAVRMNHLGEAPVAATKKKQG